MYSSMNPKCSASRVVAVMLSDFMVFVVCAGSWCGAFHWSLVEFEGRDGGGVRAPPQWWWIAAAETWNFGFWCRVPSHWSVEYE